ncbi:MAG: hypothetical protein AAF197_01805 [Pseudomonadota bacterium]
MKSSTLNDVLACLPAGRTHFRYYKGAYASRLLALLIDNKASIGAVKQSNFKSLLTNSLVKQHMAETGQGFLCATKLEELWQEPSLPFLLGLDRWGQQSHWRWNQTSRPGENIVLQLILPLVHKRLYDQNIDQRGVTTINGRYSAHPVQKPGRSKSYRDTLAWARIDFDLDTSEALIEEVQSDAVRNVYRWQRRVGDCPCSYCSSIRRYINWFKKYDEVWAEAMLMAAIWFIKYELGLDTVYYHSDRSGWQLKNMDKNWRAPKSLYSRLPRKFCFTQTWTAPEFLLGTRAYQQVIRRNPDIDFYRLKLGQLTSEVNHAT